MQPILKVKNSQATAGVGLWFKLWLTTYDLSTPIRAKSRILPTSLALPALPFGMMYEDDP